MKKLKITDLGPAALVLIGVLLVWGTVSIAADAAVSGDLPVGLGEEALGEEASADLLVSADEYPHEGGDALNELMTSIVKMRTFDQESYGLEGNYEIIDETRARLEEAGTVDRVRLVSLRDEDGVYDNRLILEIIPPDKEPFIINLSDDIKGFQSSISIKNFTSRMKSEIILTFNSGRWGDRYLIIEVADGKGEVIFDTHATKIPTVLGKFFDNYRAEIIVQETSERALIDLSVRKDAYDDRHIYNDGLLRTNVDVRVDRYSQFEAIDVDYDGIFEISEIMDLSGAGRADSIAYVEAILKFFNGEWVVLESWIAPVEELSKQPIPQIIN